MLKIQNLKFKTQNSNEGYTLIELLVVTTIIIIVSGIIVGILYSTLRGGNKTKATNDVSQNGNYALSVISNTAMLSESVTKVGGSSISDCTSPKTGKSIELKQEDGSLINFTCDAASSSITQASNGGAAIYLIDNSSVMVDSTKCSFTCLQNDNNPYASPVISVVFTVSQRSSAALFENTASSSFNTSVTIRNYNPK